MKWIIIIVVMAGGYRYDVEIGTTQLEFTSKEACAKALIGLETLSFEVVSESNITHQYDMKISKCIQK